MSPIIRAAAFCVGCLLVQAAAGAAQAGRGGNIAIDPIVGKGGGGELLLWIAYATRMSGYLNEIGEAETLTARYEPSFEAEVTARESQARSWRELNQKKPDHSVYGDDIVRVQSAGFMREYVWRYYRRPAWGAAPVDLRMSEFDAWARDELASHVPYTGAYLDFTKR